MHTAAKLAQLVCPNPSYISTKVYDNKCQAIVTFSYHVTAQIRIKVNNSTAAFVKPFAENIVEANVHFVVEKIFLMNLYAGP
jgi:hypothetical protein